MSELSTTDIEGLELPELSQELQEDATEEQPTSHNHT